MQSLLSATALILAATAPGDSAAQYQVDARISINGREVGAPRLFVDEARSTTVEVGGTNGYRMTVSIITADVSGHRLLLTEIARPSPDGGWTVMARPRVRFAPGQPVAISGADGVFHYSLAVRRP